MHKLDHYYLESRYPCHRFQIPERCPKYRELKRMEETGEIDRMFPKVPSGMARASLFYKHPRQLKDMEFMFNEDGSFSTDDADLMRHALKSIRILDPKAQLHPLSKELPPEDKPVGKPNKK